MQLSIEPKTHLFRIFYVTHTQCSLCRLSYKSSDYQDVITTQGDINDNSVLSCFNRENVLLSFCEKCNVVENQIQQKQKLISTKEIAIAPLVLVISTEHSYVDVCIDERLTFGNFKYTLKGVIYVNDNNCIARYTNSTNDVYESRNDHTISGKVDLSCKKLSQKRKLNRFPSYCTINQKKFFVKECYYVKKEFINSNSNEYESWGIGEGANHLPILFSSGFEYGFPYDNNSCAVDSFLTFFWSQYRHSAIFKAHFDIQYPLVADVFDKMMLNKINNLEAKDEIIAKLGCLKSFSGDYNKLHDVREETVSFLTQPSEEYPTYLFRILFLLQYECQECKNTSKGYYDVNQIMISEQIYMSISLTNWSTDVIQKTVELY